MPHCLRRISRAPCSIQENSWDWRRGQKVPQGMPHGCGIDFSAPSFCALCLMGKGSQRLTAASMLGRQRLHPLRSSTSYQAHEIASDRRNHELEILQFSLSTISVGSVRAWTRTSADGSLSVSPSPQRRGPTSRIEPLPIHCIACSVLK